MIALNAKDFRPGSPVYESEDPFGMMARHLAIRGWAANGSFPLREFRTGRCRLGNTMRNAHLARSKDLW